MPGPAPPRPRRAALAYVAGLALASLYAFPLGSCTAILLNAGLEADKRQPAPGIIPRESLVLLDAGAPVVLHLADSSVVAGRYEGVGLGDPAAYRAGYEAWRSARADSASWPPVGAPVTAHGRKDPPWIRGGGAFAGFTARGVAVAGRQRDDPARELTFGETGAIGVGSRLVYPYDVHRAIGEGLPVLTTLRVRTDVPDETRAVPWREVEAVSVGKTRSRALTGALVGLAIDALVVVFVVRQMESERRSSGCNFDPPPGWNPLGGFAARAPGDFDTATGRFVTPGSRRTFAADSSHGPGPAVDPGAAPALVAP